MPADVNKKGLPLISVGTGLGRFRRSDVVCTSEQGGTRHCLRRQTYQLIKKIKQVQILDTCSFKTHTQGLVLIVL